MDYEKAYKEMVQRARELHEGGNALTKLQMEIVCPELAESEDERIRKWLLGICKNMAHACRLDLAIDTEDAELKKELANYEASILYLEKQKVNTDGDFARGYDCGYECCLNSHGAEWLEKQKEQKSEQSEMEKEYVRTLHSLISDFLCGKQEIDREYYQKIWDWLDNRHIEQIPAEWSEDDEIIRDSIIEYINSGNIYATSRVNMITWLEYLRPQSHWKPTKEQMDELEKVYSGNTCAFNYGILRKLYDDLKKL